MEVSNALTAVNHGRQMPLVTAMLVTGMNDERYRFAEIAIQCFKAQTYVHKELLIINQGSRILNGDGDAEIREIMVPEEKGQNIGKLRNIALKHATAGFVIIWDDDDWHSAERISVQMSAQKNNAVVLLRNQFRYNLLNGCGFVHTSCGGIPNSILFPLHEGIRYADLPRGEDSDLLKHFPDKIVIDNDPQLHVRTFHGANLWDSKHMMKEYADPSIQNQIDLPGEARRQVCRIMDLYPHWTVDLASSEMHGAGNRKVHMGAAYRSLNERERLVRLYKASASKHKMAVVTCVFSITTDDEVWENYALFANMLHKTGVPLFTVELAFGSQAFHLDEGPRVWRFRTEEFVWQRERIYNMVAARLPEEIEKICFVNPEIIFTNPEWYTEAEILLDHHLVVQPFNFAYLIGGRAEEPEQRVGVADLCKSGIDVDMQLHEAVVGLAVAVRREFISQFSFFDRMIGPASQSLLLLACLGLLNERRLSACGAVLRVQIQEWADSIFKLVNGKVGVVDMPIVHLKHSDEKRLRGSLNTDILEGFNPSLELAYGENHLWKLNEYGKSVRGEKLMSSRLSLQSFCPGQLFTGGSSA